MAEDSLHGRTQSVWGVINHDHASPLTVLQMNLKVLQEHLPSLIATYQQAVAQGMDVPAIRANQLGRLERALEASIYEAEYIGQYNYRLIQKFYVDRKSPHLTPLSIKDCVTKAVANYRAQRSLIEKESVQISLADAQVLADEELLIYMIYELLSNADYYIQAGSTKGSLFIHGEVAADNYQLTVKTTGYGVSEQDRPHIFDAYFSTRGKIGLGLYYCQQVMQLFKGDISCRSKEEQFTEFVLTFKLSKAEDSKT